MRAAHVGEKRNAEVGGGGWLESLKNDRLEDLV